MKYSILTGLILFFSTIMFSQIKPIVDFQVGVESGNPGDTICVPIKVRNFNGIATLQFAMRWDTSNHSFSGINYYLADLSAQNFNLFEVENGNIRISWIAITDDFTGLTLEDNETIFDLCLILKDTSKAHFSPISFDDELLFTEVVAISEGGDVLEARPNFIPGGIFTNGVDNPLQILPEFFFEIECGAYSAAINANVQGGDQPYEYEWSGPGVFFSNSNMLPNIRREGIYTLEVSDPSGNIAFATIRVDFMGNEDGLAIPEFASLSQTPNCFSNLGFIAIEPSNPNSDYAYVWSTNQSDVSILDNLSPGEYSLTVVDNENGCTSTASYSLIPEEGQTEEDNIIVDLDCISDTISIGNAGLANQETFQFQWNTGEETPSITVLSSGTYSLTITDGICSRVENYMVQALNDAPDKADFQRIDNNIACGASETDIGVLYNGDRSDLSYLWNTGDTSSSIKAELIGIYTLDISGANNCPISFVFDVAQEEADFDFTRVESFLGCAIAQTRIGLLPNDIGNYTYDWSTGANTNTIDIAVAGAYSVTVSEAGSACTSVYSFGEEITDPTKGNNVLEYECVVTDNCYFSTQVNIQLDGYTAPVTYALSDGSRFSGPSDTSFNLYINQALEIYIEDADGCKDTISNVIANCAIDGNLSEINLRQYIVCEEAPETGEVISTVYNEVFGNLSTPPYEFLWSNGFTDTAYFRSSQALDSLPNLFIGVNDALGNQFSRQISEPVEAYACGDENAPVFTATDRLVAPGTSFTYPLTIKNHQGLERAIYTIDWDPCYLDADSIIFYTGDGDTLVDRNIFAGTYETFYIKEGGSLTNEEEITAEVYFTALEGVEGISPFIFSINEVAKNADASTALLTPVHGSIIIAEEGSTVLPGDANLNGVIDHRDLLSIALGVQEHGPERRVQQIQRRGFAYPWQKQTPLSGIDFKNMDCDGNGLINQDDLNAIDQNFDFEGAREGFSANEGTIPVYLDADTLFTGKTQSFPIVLGESSSIVADAYGIALTLSYDAAVIDPQSISINAENSWLTPQEEALLMLKNDEERQLLHIAISRSDLKNVSGFGPIANLSFQTKEVAIEESSFEISGVQLIDAQEQLIQTFARNTSARVETLTNTKEIAALSAQIQLYPNPVNDYLYVDTKGLKIQSFTIYDSNGRKYLQGNFNKNIIQVDVLPKGIYWLRFITDQGIAVKKVVK